MLSPAAAPVRSSARHVVPEHTRAVRTPVVSGTLPPVGTAPPPPNDEPVAAIGMTRPPDTNPLLDYIAALEATLDFERKQRIEMEAAWESSRAYARLLHRYLEKLAEKLGVRSPGRGRLLEVEKRIDELLRKK